MKNEKLRMSVGEVALGVPPFGIALTLYCSTKQTLHILTVNKCNVYSAEQ